MCIRDSALTDARPAYHRRAVWLDLRDGPVMEPPRGTSYFRTPMDMHSASPTQPQPSGTTGTRWHRVREALRGTREMARYHGIWSPGVRALRNMTLRAKAILVIACL